MLRALLFASCVLGPIPAQEAASDAGLHDIWWRELSVPRGFVLDLGRGMASDRPASADRPILAWGDHGLTAAVPLRFLDGLAPVGPRRRIGRDEGSATLDLPAVAGVEAVFDLGERGWGYLRVLSVDSMGCRLEYALQADQSASALERDPAVLSARSLREGIELTWEGNGSGPLLVERRPLGIGRAPAPWEEIARPSGVAWTDGGAPRGASFEYRVRRLASATGFGSTVVGVCGLAPESEALPLALKRRIDLVSCSDESDRFDLCVEYVGANGAQFSVGPLVRAHLLAPAEARVWSLPEPTEHNYKGERVFVPAGKALAVITGEGFYARVSVEVAGDGDVLLRRQIDLSGGRTFLPAPPAPELSWEARRGVTFTFPPADLECGEAATASIEVERLDPRQGGSWEACVRGVRGERELTDPAPGEGGLARYRFRYALADGSRSLPGTPVGFLVGDDGGPHAAALIERCVADLAHADFGRRSEARDVLAAIGEPAFPSLREALASSDPEQAAAARALLEAEDGGAKDGADLAGTLLGSLALARGLGTPPSAHWLAEESGARAVALIRHGLGGERVENPARDPWRALLAESDPEAGVRLLAALIPELAAAPRPVVTPSAGASRATADPVDWDLGGLDALSVAAVRTDLAERVDPTDPWGALVRLQVLRDLERDDPTLALEVSVEREVAALRRALLVESLLARRDAGARVSGGDVFIDAARAVVSDPRARLRGALDLADLRATRPPGTGEIERETVRIERASYDQVFDAVAGIEAAGMENVDLLLPPGVYALDAATRSLRVAVNGLRIVGEGDCVLRFGLTVLEGAEVAFEGLKIAPPSGTAVSCISSGVILRDCTIEAPGVGIQASSALVELVRTTLVPSGGSQNAGGVRMSGASLLLARESRIESGIGALFGARAALLERCVAVGAQRGGIIGTAGGELWLVDSYVAAATHALSKVERGVIEGSVLVGGSGVGGSLGEELLACPDHLRCPGSPGELAGERLLDRCPLGR